MKKRNKKVSKSQDKILEKEDSNPSNAKLVLLIFGIGPLLIMFLFLTYNGFFEPF